jgi:hypothetical protein
MPKILKIHEVFKVLLCSYKRNKPGTHLGDIRSSYPKYYMDVSGKAIFTTDNNSEV